jgi:hypothetical protein
MGRETLEFSAFTKTAEQAERAVDTLIAAALGVTIFPCCYPILGARRIL